MKRALIAAGLLLLPAAAAEAVLVNLNDAQVAVALAHGKTSYELWRKEGRPIDDLDPEYIVDRGPGVGRAMLFTEFSTVALETRRWLAIGRDTPANLDQTRAALRDRVRFSVILAGTKRDFLRNYKVTLVQRDDSRVPVTWDVYRSTPEPGPPPRHIATAVYTFLLKDLDPSAPVSLVLTSDDGQELRFDFDFARLR